MTRTPPASFASLIGTPWGGRSRPLQGRAAPRQYSPPVPARGGRSPRPTADEGIQDDRPEVVEQWHTAGTWMRSQVLVTGEVTGTSLDAPCLVGFTRLGNLLGLLDRQEVPEAGRHQVWLGRRSLTPSSTSARPPRR
jgi:hypothetical protein